ncbi:outer membrane beta-barrel protein [candidate division KSB1 bacterium]|nr:outer membrane beta-barrel protein [candidate division KSB1 bacterium]
MIKTTISNRFSYIAFIAIAVIASSAVPVSPQSVEAYIAGQQMSGDQTSSSAGVLLLHKSTVAGIGAGFGLGRINLNLDFLFGATDIQMKNSSLHSKLSIVDINMDYNVLKSSFTPMLTLGLGSITFSESFADVGEFIETDFAYNYGIGARWTIARRYLLKAFYRVTTTKLKDTDDAIQFKGVAICLGYSFSFKR